jgi:glycosyltransferase involved in cell wall biosynthesis
MSVMTPPFVSILTPSFNQARWLGDNLLSVAVQSYPNTEHIVMDGGSRDASVELLRSSASRRVKWWSEPDGGQSDAINKAFAKSSGDILGWLNSDDAYFSRDVVQRAVDVFKRWPAVGVVYGHAALVNGAGTILYVLWAPEFTRSRLRTFNFISQPTVFMRRSLIHRPFLVDPDCDYMMDRELWLHLSAITRFHHLRTIVAIDRHHLMKKSYTRLDLAQHDDALIRQRYELPWTASSVIVRKGLKLGLRLAGLSRVSEAARGSDAVSLTSSSAGAMAFRQIGQLRRWMPSGDR